MKDSARYAKIVEWSDEDQCYVGSAPGLILGGCHGDDERKVFDELCEIVEEAIALYAQDGKSLPPPTSGRDLANRLQPCRLGWRGHQRRCGVRHRSARNPTSAVARSCWITHGSRLMTSTLRRARANPTDAAGRES